MILSLTNANAYINGTTMLGKVEEITLPSIKPNMIEYAPLGMQSAVEVPAGYEKMEASIKLTGYDQGALLTLANFQNISIITIRGDQRTFSSLGSLQSLPYLCTISGVAKDLPLGTFKQNEKASVDVKLSVYSVQMTLGGNPIVNIDVFTNTFVVGARDLFDFFKKNI